jgi:pSer/pThr/pTyr-binding forkhead associated (FHA) protein
MSSDFTLLLIRFAYLAILWIFVLSVVSVVRSDMFGARVDASRGDRRTERQHQKALRRQAKASPTKRPRGAPTQVAIVDGANAGETVSLDLAPLLIGRGADAAIRLDDDYVSTRHARIAASGDQWYVEDLGSTNGTYIGPHRITQPTAIQLGSQVRVGKTTLELRK